MIVKNGLANLLLKKHGPTLKHFLIIVIAKGESYCAWNSKEQSRHILEITLHPTFPTTMITTPQQILQRHLQFIPMIFPPFHPSKMTRRTAYKHWLMPPKKTNNHVLNLATENSSLSQQVAEMKKLLTTINKTILGRTRYPTPPPSARPTTPPNAVKIHYSSNMKSRWGSELI